MMSSKFPALLDFYSELLHVPSASKGIAAIFSNHLVSLKTVKMEISELKKGMAQIQSELAYSKPEEKFTSVMTHFQQSAEGAIGSLERELADMQLAFQDMVQFYGQDGTSITLVA